jgi:hypothetical protein
MITEVPVRNPKTQKKLLRMDSFVTGAMPIDDRGSQIVQFVFRG